MRVLVLYAHPNPKSYVAALHQAVLESLQAAGHAVDDCDLYAEGFDPILSCEERINYLDCERNTAPVAEHVRRLKAAEALVLVYPVWNFGFPAILKGYFDRVFLPGVTFSLNEGWLKPELTNIRKLVAITTYGATPLRAFLAGDPPRKLITRMLRVLIHPMGKIRYLPLHDMNRVTQAKRENFLTRVRAEMQRL